MRKLLQVKLPETRLERILNAFFMSIEESSLRCEAGISRNVIDFFSSMIDTAIISDFCLVFSDADLRAKNETCEKKRLPMLFSHSREHDGNSGRHWVFANGRPCVLHYLLLLFSHADFLVYFIIVRKKVQQTAKHLGSPLCWNRIRSMGNNCVNRMIIPQMENSTRL